MLVTAQPPRSPAARAEPSTGLGADAGLVSGEAVELEFRVARLGSRVIALLIDVVIQIALMIFLAALVATVFGMAYSGTLDPAFLTGLRTVGVVLVLVGYPVLWETFNHGRTVGKLVVGLRVVRDDGGRVGFRQALIRGLVGVAVEWPGLVLPMLTWAASVLVTMTDPRGRRLGDLAAGTLVIHDRSPGSFGYVPVMVPPLAGWTRALDLTRLDDRLALAVRQLLSRSPTLTEPARRRLAHSLWAEVAAVTSPPPPPGLPEWTYLAAVLAERHLRARARLAGTRAVTASLWPELVPAGAGAAEPPGPALTWPVRPAAPQSTPARPTGTAVAPMPVAPRPAIQPTATSELTPVAPRPPVQPTGVPEAPGPAVAVTPTPKAPRPPAQVTAAPEGGASR